MFGLCSVVVRLLNVFFVLCSPFMSERHGIISEKTSYYGRRSSWGVDHKLGVGFTVSDAQLRDDAWRADSEDHRFDDGARSAPSKKKFGQKHT